MNELQSGVANHFESLGLPPTTLTVENAAFALINRATPFAVGTVEYHHQGSKRLLVEAAAFLLLVGHAEGVDVLAELGTALANPMTKIIP